MPWLDESLPEFPLQVWRRAAAAAEGDKNSDQLDYTVLSVAVITLGLILIVELIRHRLDVAATGRPFFKSVLEGVYKELATLGIVEFFIFLLHKYYKNLDVAQELVFADIHFTLFFTALFNALQSVFLGVVATRHSQKLWVRTEQLELDHYVEIREEFERVDALLYDDNNSTFHKNSSRVTRGSDMDAAEVPFEFNCNSLLSSFQSVTKFLRYPLLYHKHQQLLVQIRFHELRQEFFRSNDLPHQLKVSDYLKRCELHILIKLVHITTFAWLILTGGVILVYFLMGIVVFVTEDLSMVGVSLTYIFLGTTVLFVVASLIIYNKMKAIFSKIMRQRLTTEEIGGRQASEKQITSQAALFWGGDPKFIRVLIQVMQFGFAIAFSVLLVFWYDMDVPEAPLTAGTILGTVVACFAAFVLIMAKVLPRYTLCTSLGQLVNQRRLQETLAQYRLEEAQRKQELESNIECDDDSVVVYSSDDASRSSSVIMHPIESARKVLSGTFRIGRHSERSKTFEDIDFSKSSSDSEMTCVRDRRNRRKAVSEGVATMRHFGESAISALGDRVMENKAEPKQSDPPRKSDFRHESRHDSRGRRRNLSGLEDIKGIRRSSSFESLLLTQLVQTETKELRKNLNVQQRDQSLQRRRIRKKSMSDGVALMRQVLKEEGNEKKRQEGADVTSLSSSDNSSAVATVRSQSLRRERRRAVSASAAIQQMRDTTFSAEMTQSSTEVTDATKVRLPRSRQSSTGVPRLEPLVEGVPVEHSDPPLPLMPVDIDNVNENVHPDVTSTASDDKSTMETSTLGDCRSDDDDIPDVDPDFREACQAEPKPRLTLAEIGRAYFESQRYRTISGVFGTMVCFFMVGKRVESLLITSCTMPDYKNTWNVDGNLVFWIETALLSIFIIVAWIVMFLFRPSQAFTNRERLVFLSAIIDIALSSACLALLMVAESLRCCPGADQRFLAGSVAEAPGTGDCNKGGSDCCPSYGNRFYGGLGTIEPITSIIAFRVLRFAVAKKLIAYLDHRYKWSDLDVAEEHKPEPLHPFNPLFFAEDARRKKLMKNEIGTAIELWQHALGLYPDIVKEYGEFSGELLQAMLGLKILKDTSEIGRDANETSPNEGAESSTITPAVKKAEAETSHRAAMSVGKKYSRLTPEAQSIILSGKLGKSVRSMSVEGSSPVFLRKGHKEEDAGDRPAPSPFGRKEPPVANVKFELESVGDVTPQANQTFSSLLAPDARLIRSMRRCDRKLLPLLNHWSAVDVVITKWEIVYLDASNVEDMQGAGYTDEEMGNIESIRQAIIATKGGKGLRLRDVATGRKVVGHLGLSAVDEIHVERILHPDHGEYDEQHAYDGNQDIQVEFWKKKGSGNHLNLSRTSRWARVKEDRLKIHSIHGTLYLRFYSDLDDSESHHDRCVNEKESEGPIFKNNAFQWCQTIVRLCGINQLKQKLLHFGDDNANELRDYLVVVDAKNSHDAPRHMRRGKSFGDLLGQVRLHHRRPTLPELSEIFEEVPPRASMFGESQSPLNGLGSSGTRRRLFSAGEASILENGGRASLFGESQSSLNGLRRSARILRRLSSAGDAPRGGELDVSRVLSSGLPAPETTHQDAASRPTGPDMV